MDERSKTDKFYVWFDTEYSDLELDSAVLLQVAAMITDTSLRRVLPQERDIRLAVRLSKETKVSQWVEQNLPDLLGVCRSSEAVSAEEADRRLAAYVDAAAGMPSDRESKRPVLAGNSLHADWWFIRRFLPCFQRRINYRHMDVTAIKLEWELLHPDKKFEKEDPEIIKSNFPEAMLNASDNRHDAYYDVEASAAELAFYRCCFLKG